MGSIAVHAAGLALLCGLAAASVAPRARALGARLGATSLVCLGLPLLVAGWLFQTPRVWLLTPERLADLRPALAFALGWIGLSAGLRLDRRAPAAAPAAGALLALSPVVLAALAFGALLAAVTAGPWHGGLLRDALLLGACAAPSLAPRLGRGPATRAGALIAAEGAICLLMLATLATLFPRLGPPGPWGLPAAAVPALALGAGALLGAAARGVGRAAESAAAEVAGLVVAVAAGALLDGRLGLPAPLAGVAAGVVAAGSPRAAETARLVERGAAPALLVTLFVLGAGWNPTEWQGWAAAALFLAVRSGGKALAARLGARAAPRELDARALADASRPASAVAVAAIVTAVPLYGLGGHDRARWAVAAVTLGVAGSELLALGVTRFRPRE